MWPHIFRVTQKVSIRFKVRGGFRPDTFLYMLGRQDGLVSIRFKVRGGFRPLQAVPVSTENGFNPL